MNVILKLNSANPIICSLGEFYIPEEQKCSRCFYTCQTCRGVRYDECIQCKEGRGKNQTSIVGTCACSDRKSENQSGECISDGTAAVVSQSVSGLLIFELALGLILLAVNKRFFLLFYFVDTIQ